MRDVAIALPLIVATLGLGVTVAMTIRNARRGQTLVELLSHASLGVMATLALQAVGILGALVAITVTTDQPILKIDQIYSIPTKALSVLAWLCWALAAMALIRRERASGADQKTPIYRSWLALVLIGCVVGAFQWAHLEISEMVAESRHAIHYEESRIAFRPVTEPEVVHALRAHDVRHIELTSVNGELIGVGVDSGGMGFRWNALAMRENTGSPLVLPHGIDTAFAMGGYICGIAAEARASCTQMNSTSEFVVAGRTSVFLPAPVCNGHLRMCALGENGNVQCFEDSSPGEFRKQSLPLKEGIRAMTPPFGCFGCFVETTGHVRCLVRGANGEIVKNDIEGIDDAVAIASSLEQACAIERDGRLSCWSLGDNAKHGLASAPWKSQRIGDIRAKQVSVSQTHACAIDESGKVVCWGSNQWGELCDGSRMDRSAPVSAMGISDATQVSVENSVTCIVRRTGEVACCGKQRRRW